MANDEPSLDVEDTAGGIRSVERAAAVIEEISDAGREGCRLVDIVARTGLSKTTAHRLLSTLVKVGWLDLEEETGTFFLGVPLVGFGITASDRHGLLDLAQPHLQRLADLTEDTVYLSVRVAGRALCADQATGAFPIRILDPSVGDRRPLGSCAGSLALLAWMSDDEIDEVLARERHREGRDHRVPEPTVLHQMINESRPRGYTLYPGLVIPDSMGIGVPVFGADDTVVASLSVATIEPRMTEVRRGQIIEWLRREATSLSAALLRLNPRFNQGDVRRLMSVKGG
ncbi:IclR family transcriptional regulator [Streptomyces viridiviolaceus]